MHVVNGTKEPFQEFESYKRSIQTIAAVVEFQFVRFESRYLFVLILTLS